MKAKLKQLISSLLVAALLLQMAPFEALATDSAATADPPVVSSAPDESTEAAEPDGEFSYDDDASPPETYIEGEVMEARDEYEKHYRLTDGSFLAAQFQVPVHYEADGNWEDIDNTLDGVALYDGTEVYQTVNGDHVQSFASTLADGTVLSVADGEQSLTMALWDGKEDATEDKPVVIDQEPEDSSTEEQPDAPETSEPTEESTVESEQKEAAASTQKAETPDADNAASDAEPEALPTDDAPTVEPEDEKPEETQPDESAEPTEPETTEEEAEPEEALPAFNRETKAEILTGAASPVALQSTPELREVTDVIPETLENSVIYRDVYPGVDLKYETFSYNVKESIILNAPAAQSEKEDDAESASRYVYTFLLTLDGLTPTLQEDGSILLQNGDGETEYTIPAPYMMDAASEYSDSVSYSLREDDAGWLLTVTADAAWLDDADRAYPVTVDPTIVSKKNTTTFSGGIASEHTASANISKTQMAAGYHDTHGKMEGYFKISSKPSLDPGCTVVNAAITMKLWDYIPRWNSSAVSTLSMHQVTEARSGTDWLSQLTWSNKPKYGPAMDYVKTDGSQIGNNLSWDITRAAKEWYEGNGTDYGLVITSDQTASTQYRAWFQYTDHAVMSVTYRNTTGTESYYTYQTQSAVRAGAGYVGDYSSELTVIKDDLSFSNTAMPFGFNHVFNSGLRSGDIYDAIQAGITAPDYSKMRTGYGWQLSVQESIKRVTIDNTIYLVYRDDDGTQHFFSGGVNQNGSVFYDEDGLGLKITLGETNGWRTYTLTDDSGNKKFFYNAYLTYQEDGNGNKIYFVYNGASFSASSTGWYPPQAGAYLSSIVSVNKGQSTPTTICTFAYTNNYLSSITDHAGRVTKFVYANNRLVQIIHPDNTSAYYDYNTSTGHLIEMYDAEAKYGVTYTYTGNAVTSIEEFAANTKGGDKTKGSSVKRSKNGVQEAIYRYDGDDRTFDTTDDIVTRYAFDFAGRTINATTLNYNETQILGVTAAAYTASTGTSRTNNRIEKDAQGGQAGINLLSAGGLEIHDTMTAPANSWKPLQASGTGRSAAVKNTASDSSALTRTGNGSLKIYLKDTATENSTGIRRMGMYQEVSLTAGTAYTFSAYVNTRDVNTYVGDGGLYVAFMDTAGNILAAGDRVVAVTNSEIENGWQRVHVTYTPKTTGTYRVAAIQENAYLYGYFDDFQLETGKAASNVNLLQNGSFGSSAEWAIGNFHTHEGDTLHPGVIEVTAAANSMKRASQTVPISGPASDTYLLSGWAWAPSVANTESKLTDATAENNTSKRYFGLIAKCTYTDATKEYFYMPFNDDYNGWQYASCVIAPKKGNQSKTIQSITVIAAYDCNANTVWFDSISLRQEPCTTYTYDSKGNITAVNATGNSAGNFTYAAGSSRLTKSTAESTGTYEYAYTNTNNNNLVTKITNDGVSMNIGYDAHGNSVSTKVQDNSGSLASTINTTAEYSNDGAFLTSQTNSNGYKNSYTYNSIRSIASATDSKGTATVTTYYAAADLVNQSFISGVVSLKRSYTDGTLTSIQRGGYIPGNSVKQNQDYNSTYDNFGNNTALAIGSRNLVAYNYGQHNNNMSTMTYGNGDYVEYQYDTLDRLVKETYYDEKGNPGKVYEYFYDAEGNLAKKLDTKAAKAVNYEYDSLGRLIHSWETVNGKVQQKAEHLYDTSNRLSKQVWQLGDTTYSEKYSYNAANGSLGYIKGSGITDWAYEYDPLKRVSAQYNYYFKQNYSYRNINSTTTTTQLSNISYTKRNGGTNFEEFSLAYQYDTLGNISSVTGTTRTDQTASYTYDIQGQLTKEVNTKGTYNYTYDTYGNIRSISGAESHTYTYGDSEWLDLLTAFDGQSITYDAIGNPLSYYNGACWSFGWENGRQLTSASGNGKTITYTYDMDGIRDSKTVNGTTYNYITQDGLVVRQTWGSNVMDFTYDNNSRPYACVYQGKTYYYVLNLQGDVVGIINNTGAYVAKYAYDAWGNVISQSGWLAATNPIRYRGYYYDQDTGMYYLQTRYYDPVVRRFINADMPELAGGDNTFLGLNLFAYCTNNPVMNMDEDGCLSNGWKIAITAGLLVAATAVIVATGGVASGPVMCAAISAAQGAVTGAVSGAASGAAIGAVTGAIKHRATTGSWKGAGKAVASGAKQGAIDGAFTGAITGAVSGALHPTHCFVAGTAIAAAAGYVAIETLKPGDLVWAWDEETGDVALKPVKQLFINESDELIHLTVNGEVITTTPTHPFYVAHKGWYAAVDLRAGDILVLVNGEYVTLEKTQHEILEAPITVYNFEVEDYHTYYVGTDGVLVHNSCSHNSKWNSERRKYWKNAAKSAQEGKNYGAYTATKENIKRMARGSAPKGWDGYSVQLHHWSGIKNDFYNYSPVSRTLHRLIHYGKV